MHSHSRARMSFNQARNSANFPHPFPHGHHSGLPGAGPLPTYIEGVAVHLHGLSAPTHRISGLENHDFETLICQSSGGLEAG